MQVCNSSKSGGLVFNVLGGGGSIPLASNRRWRFTATPSAVNLAMSMLSPQPQHHKLILHQSQNARTAEVATLPGKETPVQVLRNLPKPKCKNRCGCYFAGKQAPVQVLRNLPTPQAISKPQCKNRCGCYFAGKQSPVQVLRNNHKSNK